MGKYYAGINDLFPTLSDYDNSEFSLISPEYEELSKTHAPFKFQLFSSFFYKRAILYIPWHGLF